MMTDNLFMFDENGILAQHITATYCTQQNILLLPVMAPDISVGSLPPIPYKFNAEEDYENFYSQFIRKREQFDGVVVVIDATHNEIKQLHETTHNHWNRLVEQHLKHCFLLSQLAIDEFLSRQTSGKITFVVVNNDNAFAKILKTSLSSFSRSIAKEYGKRKIYCNKVDCALPGQYVGETVNLVLNITSSKATFITGEVISI